MGAAEAEGLYLRKIRLHREIEAADRRIDQLVYELYGLTEEEFKIVEESVRNDGGIHCGA